MTGGHSGRDLTTSLRTETGPSASGVLESKTDETETRRLRTATSVSRSNDFRSALSARVILLHSRPEGPGPLRYVLHATMIEGAPARER